MNSKYIIKSLNECFGTWEACNNEPLRDGFICTRLIGYFKKWRVKHDGKILRSKIN
jgi:hypothetical protein